MLGRSRGVALLLAAAAATGCELTEVTLVDFADVVVVEAYVTVAETPAENHLRAFIHGTSSGSAPSSERFDDALVTVTDGVGVSTPVGLSVIDECVSIRPEDSDGSCFAADAVFAASLDSGKELTLGRGEKADVRKCERVVIQGR